MKDETFKYIGEKPWEYLPLVNECIKVLLTIGIGIITGYFQVFDVATFVPQATRFVFYVALPFHVLKGVGIGVDFYDDSFLWKFIIAFLILRVVALVLCIVVVVWRQRRLLQKTGGIADGSSSTTAIGEIAVWWLNFTWISTIILGVPISSAVFGDPNKGRTYGILAAISSFICQLPLQLFFLECHVLIRDSRKNKKSFSAPPKEDDDEEAVRNPTLPLTTTTSPKLVEEKNMKMTPTEEEEEEEVEKQPEEEAPKELQVIAEESAAAPLPKKDDLIVVEEEKEEEELSTWFDLAKRGDIWMKIFIQILQNPVLWGIAGGFALSLSTLGPRFLNPTSPEFVPGFQWIFATATWLGECVSPVSLFAMGIWMQAQGFGILFKRISFLSSVFSMISKLVIVPLVMVGLAKAFDLEDEPGRAAVLIASLPISMASFSLASRYKIGEEVLSQNVALGTALILPTVLIWNIVMDAVDLYPLPPK